MNHTPSPHKNDGVGYGSRELAADRKAIVLNCGSDLLFMTYDLIKRCVYVFLLTFLTRLTDALQAQRLIISFLLALVFFRTFAVHLRQIDSYAVMC